MWSVLPATFRSPSRVSSSSSIRSTGMTMMAGELLRHCDTAMLRGSTKRFQALFDAVRRGARTETSQIEITYVRAKVQNQSYSDRELPMTGVDIDLKIKEKLLADLQISSTQRQKTLTTKMESTIVEGTCSMAHPARRDQLMQSYCERVEPAAAPVQSCQQQTIICKISTKVFRSGVLLCSRTSMI